MTGVQDLRAGLKSRQLLDASRFCLLIACSLFCTPLVGRWLHPLYVWMTDQMADNPCETAMNFSSDAWFLVSLALLKLIVGFVSYCCPRRLLRRLLPALGIVLHYASFSDRTPWPFSRVPISPVLDLYKGASGSWIGSWLPSVQHKLSAFLILYMSFPVFLPSNFPAMLPGERGGGTQARRNMVRLLWAVVPWLALRNLVPIPNMNAGRLPYAALPCAVGATPWGYACAWLALQRVQACSVWHQWSVSAFAQDAYAQLLVLVCTCSLCAWIPRRRIPLIATIGDHSLICYLTAPFFHSFLTVRIEQLANAAVALGILEAQGPTLLLPVVLPFFILTFWLLACGMKLIAKQSNHLAQARMIGPVAIPFSLAMVLAALLYDPLPARCEQLSQIARLQKNLLEYEELNLTLPSCKGPPTQLPGLEEPPRLIVRPVPPDGQRGQGLYRSTLYCSQCLLVHGSCSLCAALGYDCSATTACTSALESLNRPASRDLLGSSHSSMRLLQTIPMHLLQIGLQGQAAKEAKDQWTATNPSLRYTILSEEEGRDYLKRTWGAPYMVQQAHSPLRTHSHPQLVPQCRQQATHSRMYTRTHDLPTLVPCTGRLPTTSWDGRRVKNFWPWPIWQTKVATMPPAMSAQERHPPGTKIMLHHSPPSGLRVHALCCR